jgi:NTP pyrophosphatase (non-canonical NTP hydrolase)
MELRDEVAIFAQGMENKLRQNDHKGGWENCSVEYLLNRVNEELLEVHKAIYRGKSKEEVVGELADVANFLMMIGENYVKKGPGWVE